MNENRCRNCGEPTGSTDSRKKYCGDSCRKEAWAARHPRVSIELPDAARDADGTRFRVRLEITASVVRED